MEGLELKEKFSLRTVKGNREEKVRYDASPGGRGANGSEPGE